MRGDARGDRPPKSGSPAPAPPSTALERWLYDIAKRGTASAMEDPIMKKILEESPDIAAAERRYGTFIADECLRSSRDALR